MTKEELYHLYHERGLSQTEIGKLYSKSQAWVGQQMKNMGIPTKRIEPSQDELYNLYYKDNLTLEQIGKNYKKSRGAIKQRMIQFNIPIKRRGGVKQDPLVCFLRHIKFPDNSSDCWEWVGAKQGWGGGAFHFEGHTIAASRFSYLLFKGKIPPTLFVCHSCDNPCCVNPTHLWIGDQKANMDDMRQKDRRALGEKHGNSKLTESNIKEIRQFIKQGLPLTKIGELFNVKYKAIYKIKTGCTWKHVQ